MNVKRKLKEAGFTQKGFADLMGLHPVTVNRWVKKGSMPKWAKLFLRERKVLGTEIHEALQGQTETTRKFNKARRKIPWTSRKTQSS